MHLFELTKTLIEIDSTTEKEAGICLFIRDYLRDRGFRVEIQEVSRGRVNIVAFRKPPALVFSTHMDTVAPYVPFSEDEEFLYGRGACDAKGIMASQIKALEKLHREGFLNAGLLLVVGEESGSDGARKANFLKNDCRFLINGEPTENKMAIGSKGAIRFRLDTKGRTAHSAYPGQGESAILKMLDIFGRWRSASWPERDPFGETTWNIGYIEGGIQANVIPDHAMALLMFRTVTPSADTKGMIESLLDGQGKIQYIYSSDPVLLNGVEGFESTIVSYGTDIPLLTNWGKPFLLGPGSILDAHTKGERVSKAALEDAVELYCRICRSCLGHPA